MKKTSKVQRSPQHILEKPLYVRLTPEEKALVENYASMEARSRASFLRFLILLGLKQFERERAHSIAGEVTR